MRGYVAGYNAYLRDTGVDRLPDPRCRGKAWVRPITEMDAFRRFYQLALLASSGVAVDGIGAAQPPAAGRGARSRRPAFPELPDLPLGDLGSNAVALGKSATSDGKGLLLGNPHFPWDGPERFYQAQLTIPGKVDVTGASLFGVPLVLIGHTRRPGLEPHGLDRLPLHARTSSSSSPARPPPYLVDGQPRQMRAQTVTVQARKPTSAEPRSRTLYTSTSGRSSPRSLGQPLFPWTPATAYAMGDANATTSACSTTSSRSTRRRAPRELDAIERRYQGIPWVNTIAADSTGAAYYADIGTVPHVTDEEIQACNTTALGQVTFQALGLPVLDGSRASCAWGSDPDAVVPGILGPSRMPSLFRDDYVTNSNDSYWLSNPAQPLEGFDRIIGDERTERSLRTRTGLRIVADQLAKGPFTPRLLQDAVFSNRSLAGELMRDDLVALCRARLDLGERVRRAGRLGPAREPRLARRGAVPALR